MALRTELPNVPAAGTVNASVLKNRPMPGSGSPMGAPVTSARSEQLVPWAMSNAAPHTRAVNGSPDCAVNAAAVVHPPTMPASTPPLDNQRRSEPNGSSYNTLPVNTCRRSKFDRAHSAPRLFGSCATSGAPEPSDGVLSIDLATV